VLGGDLPAHRTGQNTTARREDRVGRVSQRFDDQISEKPVGLSHPPNDHKVAALVLGRHAGKRWNVGLRRRFD